MQFSMQNMKLKHRLLMPNFLYVFLLVFILIFFFNAKALITSLSEEQSDFSALNQDISQTALSIKGYIYGDLSYQELESEYQKVISEMGTSDLVSDFKSLWTDVVAIQDLRAKNDDIEAQVVSLTNDSISISDAFIEQVSEKLANEVTKSDVTPLEILTLPGANRNSNVNYQVQVQFGYLKESLDEKENMLNFLDKLLQNVEADIKKLSGTDFEQMAVDSRDLVLVVRDLTSEYISNLETVNTYETNIFDKIDAALGSVEKISDAENKSFFSKVLSYFHVMLWIVVIISIIGFVLSAFFGISVTKLIARVAGGLGEGSDQIANASSELSSASQTLAAGSSEQAASIEETSSSLEEMASMTGQNSEHAVQADSLMKTVQGVVKLANGSMQELTVSMDAISKASEETRKIVKTIDEIAFQTNLLALNAAVEAARAGEAGAGFAVVADEVRSLAMRAAEAAKNTAGLIDDTVKKIQDGANLVDQTNDAFSQVDENASKVGHLVAEIASASKEQAEGVEQINRAVTEMDKVVQQNAASAEENASASEEMNAQAVQMKAYVAELVRLVEGGVDRKDRAVRKPTPRLAGTVLKSYPRRQTVVRDVTEKASPKMLSDSLDFEEF